MGDPEEVLTERHEFFVEGLLEGIFGIDLACDLNGPVDDLHDEFGVVSIVFSSDFEILSVEEVELFVIVTIDRQKGFSHSGSSSSGGSLRVVGGEVDENLVETVLYEFD